MRGPHKWSDDPFKHWKEFVVGSFWNSPPTSHNLMFGSCLTSQTEEIKREEEAKGEEDHFWLKKKEEEKRRKGKKKKKVMELVFIFFLLYHISTPSPRHIFSIHFIHFILPTTMYWRFGALFRGIPPSIHHITTIPSPSFHLPHLIFITSSSPYTATFLPLKWRFGSLRFPPSYQMGAHFTFFISFYHLHLHLSHHFLSIKMELRSLT